MGAIDPERERAVAMTGRDDRVELAHARWCCDTRIGSVE